MLSEHGLQLGLVVAAATCGLGCAQKRIAATGLTILIIDHDMTLIADVAERITVLNFGQCIADGVATDVLRQPDVIAAYLGSEIDAPAGA